MSISTITRVHRITKTNATFVTAFLLIFLNLPTWNSILFVRSTDVEPSLANFAHDSCKPFEAIKILHSKLDVDADGQVDDVESKIYLESEKVQVNGNAPGADSNAQRHQRFHKGGKDRSISLRELWEAWEGSQVHNWTVDDTVYWLVNYVELPEYSQLFESSSINGTMMPCIAADSHFLSRRGITDPSAKSKISIKATDVVLFGPPKMGQPSKTRDIIVTLLTLIALSSCYIFYSRSIASQRALRQIQDSKLESLKKAEDQMLELQQELDKAIKAQEEVATAKKNLEQQLEMQRQYSASTLSDHSRGTMRKQASSNGDNLSITSTLDIEKDQYVSKLEGELKMLRHELQETLESKKFRAPFPLRNLLQATYQIESQYYNEKKLNLEIKATEIKLRNQKLQKKKTSFLGYYRMAQENSLEEDINTIAEIKDAILQVTKEIKARSERWRAIEEHCGCPLEFLCK